MSKIIAVVNQKGGVGKTTVTINLGVGLARAGKKVLLVDMDPQGSLTDCIGIPALLGGIDLDGLDVTVADILLKLVNEEDFPAEWGLIAHPEGVDVMPANIKLAGIEVVLVNVMCREQLLKSYLERIRDRYDYILIDCMPSLGILTVNALAAADLVIIPVLAAKPSVLGLQQLIKTIGRVRQMNKSIQIGGIVPNMVDIRTNYAKDIVAMLQEAYGRQIRVFDSIPQSVRMAETSAEGKSIYAYAPRENVARAYEKLVREVMSYE